MIVSLTSPKEATIEIAQRLKERRLALGYTQNGLAKRAGVSVSTLRKFERTAKISLESFLRLVFILELMDDLLAVFAGKKMKFSSIQEVLKPESKKRQRGWKK